MVRREDHGLCPLDDYDALSQVLETGLNGGCPILC
jgi:hypothetical protein